MISGGPGPSEPSVSHSDESPGRPIAQEFRLRVPEHSPWALQPSKGFLGTTRGAREQVPVAVGPTLWPQHVPDR